MKIKNKSILKGFCAISLAACMLIGYASPSAGAAAVSAATAATPAEDFIYEENDNGGITITGYNGSDTEIVIPSQIDGKPVTAIGDSAFDDCTGLTSIEVAESNEAYSSQDGVLFNKDKSKLVKFPEGKTGAYAIPESVTEIGYMAFRSCQSLTSITIPDSVTKIGDWAFVGCTGLTEITIPESVTVIGISTFAYCTGLTEITIHDSVTKIGYHVFAYCTGLTGIIIPNSVTKIDDLAFEDCTGLTSIEVAENNKAYSSQDGVLFSKDKSKLVKFPEGKTGAYAIPESVMEIRGSAFEDCTGLTEITIPDSVTKIGNSAFAYCSELTEITIPDSVTYIGDNAFEGCTGLTSIIIPDSVTYIGYGAFGDCDNLTIYGYRGSCAEAYASEYDIPFVALDDTDPDKGMIGDVNLDGKVDITDATYVQMSVASVIELSAEEKANADANGNGTIDVTDATYIQMIAANIMDSFR